MTINAHVADLFFNLDFEDAKTWSFIERTHELDLDRVKQKAAWFCDALHGAGGPAVDPDELVEEFYKNGAK